ncbi:substrate-binding domain-containing protein, partial [candidate division KSB1 bacterium]|nr:substrate-binding domain-containing protein [candidate division KSB1 bacterium]
ARNNFSIILCNTDDLFVRTEYHANQLLKHGIAGLIFMPTAAEPAKNNLIIEKFKQKNIPVVLADREIPGAEYDMVTTDNFHGAFTLTDYLISKGHRKIAITLSTLFSSERTRLEGYKAALKHHHIKIDPSIIFTTEERFIEKQYREFARFILSQREKYSVIFAGNDPIAYIIYNVASELNISIPAELSLAGYDDLAFSGSHPMELTTIHQPIYEMGLESMKILLMRMQGKAAVPQKIILNSHLVERKSVISVNHEKL